MMLIFLPQNVNLRQCFILGYLRKLFFFLSAKLLFDSIDSLHLSVLRRASLLTSIMIILCLLDSEGSGISLKLT